MDTKSNDRTSTADREFTITRTFNAPAALVFKAWTDPKHMAQWWGPHHFTNPVCELDVKPGGNWRIIMRAPDGAQHPAKGVYREIIPNKRLVFTIDHSDLPDEWHDIINPDRDKSKGRPKLEALTTVTFDESNGKTKLTIRLVFESAAVRDRLVKIGMNDGWSQSLERLGTELGNIKG
ncbi:MAG TPA: SRPBCC domain-containing protein [Humisphaera sp.]|nr:SRPBCC domain-containing protein [Humisphaera sp.]